MSLEGFEQDEDGVVVTLSGPDGPVRQRVPWLAGCDGGHSTVRKKLGLALLGESSETWLIADADVEADLPRNSIHWVRSGGVTMMMVPMSTPGRWRLLDTESREHDSRPAAVAERFGRALSQGLGRPVKVAEPSWISVFTFQQRMITEMRSRRCLLVGDAAHVHSPASGQGMNTGIQEAFNLAWKLAMVLHGQAEPALLDSYSAERVPVGRALLQSTKGATFLVQLKNSLADLALPVVFTFVRTLSPLRGAIQRKVLGGVSGLRLAYPDSPLTFASRPRRRSTGPVPGSRVTAVRLPDGSPAQRTLAAQLRNSGWTLFVNGPVDEGAVRAVTVGHDWLDARVLTGPEAGLAAALGIPEAGWMLVRPDGYVSARGDRLDGSHSPVAALAAATGRHTPARA